MLIQLALLISISHTHYIDVILFCRVMVHRNDFCESHLSGNSVAKRTTDIAQSVGKFPKMSSLWCLGFMYSGLCQFRLDEALSSKEISMQVSRNKTAATDTHCHFLICSLGCCPIDSKLGSLDSYVSAIDRLFLNRNCKPELLIISNPPIATAVRWHLRQWDVSFSRRILLSTSQS